MISVFVMVLIFLFVAMIGVPISIAMGVATLFALLIGGNAAHLFIITRKMIAGVESYTLLAVPFFIFIGYLLVKAGITERIFDFASALMRHVRGGLAQVNVLASMILAGTSGSSVADAAGLGIVEVKEMADRGYLRSYAAAITAASATIGPIIPPSIGAIIYAVVANVSVARVFLAGVIPGVLVGSCLMAMNVFFSYTKDFPKPEKRASIREIIETFRKTFPALLTLPIILIGLLGGYTTAAEAGLIAAVYCLSISFIYNKPKQIFKILPEVLLDTVISTAMVMYIVALATSLGWVMAFERAPALAAQLISSITQNPLMFLLILNIFLLILGTVLETIPAMLITLPVLLPIVDKFGIDRIHFSKIIHLSLLIGELTPPMAILLYVIVRVADISFDEAVRATLPFLIPLIVALFLVTYIPSLTLLVPNLLMGK
jgi:tripartite ATP-independent transporter DctM subunit